MQYGCDSIPVLVEGPFDCLSLRRLGFSAFAIQGSKLSLWQAAHLSYFAQEGVVCCYPDRDGQKNVVQWFYQLGRMELRAILPSLPYAFTHAEDADPDWLARYDPSWLLDVLGDATKCQNVQNVEDVVLTLNQRNIW